MDEATQSSQISEAKQDWAWETTKDVQSQYANEGNVLAKLPRDL